MLAKICAWTRNQFARSAQGPCVISLAQCVSAHAFDGGGRAEVRIGSKKVVNGRSVLIACGGGPKFGRAKVAIELCGMEQADETARRKLLAEAVRAVRLYRRMTVAEVAEKMAMPLRTYQHLEAGGGRLSLETIFAFADATDSDGMALALAVLLRAPELAVWSADNKLVTIMMITLQDFRKKAGRDMAGLRPQQLISAFKTMFDDLAEEATPRESGGAQQWLAERIERLRKWRAGESDDF
jgi:transcriptional regulator with XRE-family HTH domain